MTEAECAALVRKVLFSVAPDLEGETIAPEETFRDQFEIDSMDFVGFVLAFEKELGVTIPEIDYPLLSSMDGCVRYVDSKQQAAPS